LRQAIQRLEGDTELSADKQDGQPTPADSNAKKTSPRRKGAASDDVGRALRRAYDDAVSEEVPDDFLDLLGKLS